MNRRPSVRLRDCGLVVASASLALGCGRLRFDDTEGLGDSGPVDPDALVPRANRVFAASGPLSGNLGGLEGADATCRSRAESAGLPGTFIAFLSTSTTDAIGRLSGSRGWERVDGKPVVDTIEDLMAEKQYYPIDLDEQGQPLTFAVATGSHSTGLRDVANCTDWTSTTDSATFGSPTSSSGASIRFGYTSCSVDMTVYCFETGHDVPIAPPPVITGGRVLFVTSTDWTFGSLSTADTLCNNEAGPAGLPGTYTALLATDGASAASRLTSLAGPWKRPDGRLVTSGPLGTLPLELPPDLYASGAHFTGDAIRYVWMGAEGITTAGDVNSTCAGWTMPIPAAGYGLTAYSDETASTVFGWAQARTRCDGTMPVYCAQN